MSSLVVTGVTGLFRGYVKRQLVSRFGVYYLKIDSVDGVAPFSDDTLIFGRTQVNFFDRRLHFLRVIIHHKIAGLAAFGGVMDN